MKLITLLILTCIFISCSGMMTRIQIDIPREDGRVNKALYQYPAWQEKFASYEHSKTIYKDGRVVYKTLIDFKSASDPLTDAMNTVDKLAGIVSTASTVSPIP